MTTRLYYYNINAKPNLFFDTDSPDDSVSSTDNSTDNELEENLEALYIERANKYAQDYEAEYKKIRFGAINRENTYTTLKFNILGVSETIVLDTELDARLLEIYMLYGWQGISTIEEAIDGAQKKTETKHTEPWTVIVSFFNFTRNRLIALIRQSLIDIELQAAQSIHSRLEESAKKINDAWVKLFNFTSHAEEVNKRKGLLISDTPVSNIEVTYTMGNIELSKKLYPLVKSAVYMVDELNKLRKHKARLDQSLEDYRNEGMNSPPISAIEAPLEAQKLIDQHNLELEAVLKEIHALAPFAMPAVDLLNPNPEGITQADVDNAIGQFIHAYYADIDKLANTIKPQTSNVRNNTQGLALSTTIDPGALEKLYEAGYDLEDVLVSNSMENSQKDHSYLVLLNLETLQQLIADGSIAKGSMNYLVINRYMAILIRKVEAVRFSEGQWQSFLASMFKLQAFLDLSAWYVSSNPETTVVAPLLKWLAAAFGLTLMYFQVHSIVHQISKFDQLIAQKIISHDAYDFDFLSALGELAAMRINFMEELTSTVIKELVIIWRAGKWGIVKETIHLRGYYLDLETLLV